MIQNINTCFNQFSMFKNLHDIYIAGMHMEHRYTLIFIGKTCSSSIMAECWHFVIRNHYHVLPLIYILTTELCFCWNANQPQSIWNTWVLLFTTLSCWFSRKVFVSFKPGRYMPLLWWVVNLGYQVGFHVLLFTTLSSWFSRKVFVSFKPGRYMPLLWWVVNLGYQVGFHVHACMHAYMNIYIYIYIYIYISREAFKILETTYIKVDIK